jgi:hypothetical protein
LEEHSLTSHPLEETSSQRFKKHILETTGRHLYTVPDIEAADDNVIPAKELQPLQKTAHWIRTFLMRPHPNLGRPGVVCPYIKPAIDESLLYLTVARMQDPESEQEIDSELNLISDIYQEMEPKEGDLAVYRCIITLFPETPEAMFNDPPYLGELKTRMMRKDITIGQFFPETDTKARLKSKFFPIEDPVAMYVMRGFFDFDWVFIHRETEWRKIYIEKFGAPPSGAAG